MRTVIVTHTGAGGLAVSFPQTAGDENTSDAAAHEEEPDEGPSPIAPEYKELLWGFGAFAVFLILMRIWLVPKVKKGMEARYGKIRGEHETADSIRAAAHRDVAEYQAALADVRAEATARIDAARAELEAKGVEFIGETFDTGVCRMAFFNDPDGNDLMLHHRYTPR